MFLVSGRNTERGINVERIKEISDRELLSQKRRKAEINHRLWIQALDRLKAEKQQKKVRTDAEKIFRRLSPFVAGIVHEIAEKHSVSHLDIMSKTRRQPVVKARNEVFYTIKSQRMDWSFPMMGRMFDRDHTVIMHGISAHSQAAKLPPITSYDAAAQRVKKAHRARTRYLWDTAA